MDELLDRLFVEKVRRLKKNRFLRFCHKETEFSIQTVDPFSFPKINGVSRLSIDSFVLHFRLFLLTRDNISYKKTLERLDKKGFASNKSKDLVKSFEKYKDQILATYVGGKKYSFYEIFEIVFYGGLAHHNPDKVERFLQFASHPIMAGFSTTYFIQCVKRIFAICKSLELDIIKYHRSLNHDGW